MTTFPTANTRLAIVPDPLDDEPLDGWLERTADGLCCSLSDLRAFIGVPTKTWLLRDASEQHLEAIADSTEVPTSTLRNMTLARWAPLGVPFGPGTHTAGAARLVTRRPVQVCSACLAQRGGAHRLDWLITYTYACPAHERLLHPVDTWDQTLDSEEPARLPAAALRGQEFLDRLLTNPTQPVDSLGLVRPAWECLRDLGALTRLALASPVLADPGAHAAQLAAHGHQDWLDRPFRWSFQPSLSPPARMNQARLQPSLMGCAVTLAATVLTAQSRAAGSDALWWATASSREEAVHHARGRHLSWTLVRVLDDLPARSRPTRQLLMRLSLVRDQRDGSLARPLDSAKVPASAWPSALPQRSGGSREISAVVTSAALVAIGASRGLHGALDRLDHPHVYTPVHEDWRRTFGGPDGDEHFTTVTALHAALLNTDVPINYARRRRTFTQPHPLGRNTLKRVAQALDLRATERLGTFAGWRIWEMLTGSDVLLSPGCMDLWGNHRIAYRAQREQWLQLLDHRIDEPVTWSPILDNGSWVMPPVDVRLLPGWTTTGTALRATARLHPHDTGGFGLAEAVVLAAGGDTQTARHLARNMNRFHMVANAGSLKAGATAMGLAPATVSVQLRDLERDLATTLMDRTGTHATPTAQGMRLLRLIEAEPRLHHSGIGQVVDPRPGRPEDPGTAVLPWSQRLEITR